MKKYNASFATPVRDGQRGQSLVMVAILFPVLLLMAALVIDLGYIYVSYQSCVCNQAAALAGGAAIPNPSGPTALSIAQRIARRSHGELNYHANLQHVSISSGSLASIRPRIRILGLPPCDVYPNCHVSGMQHDPGDADSEVPTFFAKIFGVAICPNICDGVGGCQGRRDSAVSRNVGARYNGFDGSTSLDSGCTQNGTSVTPEQCAQYGVQTLLAQLDPCHGAWHLHCTRVASPGRSRTRSIRSA